MSGVKGKGRHSQKTAGTTRSAKERKLQITLLLTNDSPTWNKSKQGNTRIIEDDSEEMTKEWEKKLTSVAPRPKEVSRSQEG